jgi:hypothetical protein
MTFLAAHWKAMLLAGAFGAVAAWLLKPNPQPAVSLKEEAHKTSDVTAEVHKEEGPTRTTERRFARTCPGQPAVVVRETITERGPVSTETTRVGHATEDRKLDLTITPPARPGWQIQAGLEDVLHEKTLRLAARRRLFGPFWAEVAVQPATRSLGAGLAVEF